MDQKEVHFYYSALDNPSLLSQMDQSLFSEALTASQKAYAPYSDFRVGVAIRTHNGNVITGSNQENGSFPVGQCAERVALYRMIHELGRQSINSIAIVSDHVEQKTPASPCGSCRQMLVEYRNFQEQPIRLILGSAQYKTIYLINDVRDLLPLSFEGFFLSQ